MKTYKYEITAEDLEGFQKVKKTLDALPEGILSKVKSAHIKFDIIYVELKTQYDDTIKIELSKDVFSMVIGITSFKASYSGIIFHMTKTEKQIIDITFK